MKISFEAIKDMTVGEVLELWRAVLDEWEFKGHEACLGLAKAGGEDENKT